MSNATMKQKVLLAIVALGLVLSMITPFVAYADEGEYGASYVYKNNAGELVTVTDDLFAHVGRMLPGDSATGTVSVDNKADREYTLTFWIEEYTGDLDEVNREEARELFDKLELTITKDGKQLFAGTLNEAVAADPVQLGTYQPGETATLNYTLTVPEDLTNIHEWSTVRQNWVFAATDKVDTTVNGGTDAPGNYGDGKGSPKTGDMPTTLLGSVGFGVLFMVGIILFVMERNYVKRRREAEDDVLTFEN